MPHDRSLIAQRFRLLEAVRPDFPIKARDLASAQTVVLHAVAGLDRRLIGIFHPSVLTIFDIVNHDGQSLAACEFVPAQSLEMLLAGMLWHPRRAAEIVAEVADAAAELHARGLAHGHISTASVVITAKGKANCRSLRLIRGAMSTPMFRPYGGWWRRSAASAPHSSNRRIRPPCWPHYSAPERTLREEPS